MTKPQYGEPWRSQGDAVDNVRGCCISHWHGDVARQNRAVACVNALAGLNPEAVKRRLEERDELLGVLKAIDRAAKLPLLVGMARRNRQGRGTAMIRCKTGATIDFVNVIDGVLMRITNSGRFGERLTIELDNANAVHLHEAIAECCPPPR